MADAADVQVVVADEVVVLEETEVDVVHGVGRATAAAMEIERKRLNR